MNSSKIMAVLVVATLALAIVPVVGMSDESGADAVEGPTITDVGFAETQESLFYLGKFGIFLFPYTSASSDTPTAGAGLLMSDDTLFASLSGLDTDSTYYMFIEEYDEGSSEPNARVCIQITGTDASCGLWICIQDVSIAYVDAKEADFTFRDGSFSTSTDGKRYVFSLTTQEDVSSETAALPADSTVLSQAELNDAGCCTIIVDHGVYTSDEADMVQYFGNRYGFTSSGADRYAGAESDYVAGDYLCMIVFTNLESPTITVTSEGHTYTVPSGCIDNGNSDVGTGSTGYALVVVPVDDMESSGITSLDSYQISISYDGTVYATASSSGESSNSDSNTLIIVAIVVVAVVLIIIVAVWYMKSNKSKE